MKNFKLLLATTAILSTGALLANADTDSVGAELVATIGIVNPFIITADMGAGSLRFPTITTQLGENQTSVTIAIKPDGTIDETKSNAQIFRLGSGSTNPIRISGGSINPGSVGFKSNYDAMVSAAENEKGEALTTEELATIGDQMFEGVTTNIYGGLYHISLSANSIEMREDGSGELCGTVQDLIPKWRYVDQGNGLLELRYGGTFELETGFTPASGGSATCRGSVTVTFF